MSKKAPKPKLPCETSAYLILIEGVPRYYVSSRARAAKLAEQPGVDYLQVPHESFATG